MGIYRRGGVFAHWTTIRDRDKTKVDPSTVSESIIGPCDNTVLDYTAMTNNATGIYYYYWNVPSSATYGEYIVKVRTTTGAYSDIYEDNFYVMPWQLDKEARSISGVIETKDMEELDMGRIAWFSYKEALRDAFEHHYKETPNGNPDTGTMFDGTNTTFQTTYYPIADINGDGIISGTASCATDIRGWWINSAGSYNIAHITVTNAENGEISIYQSDGSTPIPSNNEGVYLDYWTEYESFDEEIFHDAVAHLTADALVRRLKELDKVNLGDLATNVPIIEKDERRFYYKYRSLMRKITQPKFGGL